MTVVKDGAGQQVGWTLIDDSTLIFDGMAKFPLYALISEYAEVAAIFTGYAFYEDPENPDEKEDTKPVFIELSQDNKKHLYPNLKLYS
jgi:hypothetical protein